MNDAKYIGLDVYQATISVAVLGRPAGHLVFTVLGAVAQLERSLIAERVRASLRNLRQRQETGPSPRNVDTTAIAALRTKCRAANGK